MNEPTTDAKWKEIEERLKDHPCHPEQPKGGRMTPEQKRLAIAEKCGWHEEPEPVGSFNATAWWHNKDRYPSSIIPIPDYLNDLNAMQEAVATLTPQQRISYSYTLAERTIYALKAETPDEMFKLAHATAAQRAEAFGRTLGLWK